VRMLDNLTHDSFPSGKGNRIWEVAAGGL